MSVLFYFICMNRGILQYAPQMQCIAITFVMMITFSNSRHHAVCNAEMNTMRQHLSHYVGR